MKTTQTILAAGFFFIAALAGGATIANAGDIVLRVETAESGGRMLVKLMPEI
ncbi:MAG: hypothetical protein OXU31_03070 [Gammaproteobacteria bacterium]|nr:hypothetical protein [Gammaproteobacteria bacterium]